MRRTAWFFTIFFSSFFLAAAQQSFPPSALKIGVFNNPPQMIVAENAKPSGFHIELIDAILKDSGIEPIYVAGTLAESLSRLQRGDIDMLPGIGASAQRLQMFDFNTESTLINWAVIYTAKPGAARSFLDLEGMRIAVVRESIYTQGESGIKPLMAQYGLPCTFVEVDSFDACFEALESSRADAAVVSRLYGLMNAESLDVHRTDITFSPSSIKLAFRKDLPRKAEIIALVDSRLKSFKADKNSPYYQASEKYLVPQISRESALPIRFRLALGGLVLLAILTVILVLSRKNWIKDDKELRHFFLNSASMDDIRTRIIDRTLIAFSLFSIPLILSAILHVRSEGSDPFFLVYIPALSFPSVLTLLRKKLSNHLKALTLMSCLFLTGTLVLAGRGNIGIGFSYFFTAGIVAVMLYGKRWGFFILIMGLLISLLFGVLSIAKMLRVSPVLSAYFLSTASWTLAVMSLFMMFFTLVSGLQEFYTSLVGIVGHLENRVAERTASIGEINKNLQVEIQKHMESEKNLEIARQEAEKSNKAKSIFFAGMSHEIRTPLNAILGYSQILMKETGLSQEGKREVATIHSSGEHLLGLINEVLEMSKIESGKIEAVIEPCDAAAVFDEIGRMFMITAQKKNLEFAVRMKGSLPPKIMTDEPKLRQILINLIANAFKFTDFGSVIVEAYMAEDTQGKLCFSVSDTGTGIAEEDLSRIFLPFEQAEEGRNKGGTGLGLAISREYCRLLGGDITVESAVGKGSTFSCAINAPVCEGGLSDKTKAELEIIGVKEGILPRILIVDDNETNRDILMRLLSPFGFPLAQAASGEEALSLADSWAPDLLLLDLVMPGMSGQEVMQRLRADPAKNKISVIVITASASAEDKKHVIDLGVSAFIRKPFRIKTLLEEIGKLSGLSYTYSAESPSAKKGQFVCDSAQLMESFAKLPEALAEKLRAAIKSGDLEEVKDIASDIVLLDAPLAQEISAMAENFQVGCLLRLVSGDL